LSWRAPHLLRIGGDIRQGLLSGVLFTAEFMLLFVALEYTSASHAVLFLYTHPFFVALGVLFLAPGERLRPLQWAGLALSFVGVALALRVSGVESRSVLLGDLAVLAAGACWGLQTLQFRFTRLRETPPMLGLLYQLVVSSVLLILAAWLRGEHWSAQFSAITIASLAYQTVWIVGVTFWVWIWLVSHYRASELSAFTFATPIIGVIAGALMLGETIPASFAVAATVVAVGIALVNWPERTG
jgi:drug/metabolite transporter (DMT)-like permease